MADGQTITVPSVADMRARIEAVRERMETDEEFYHELAEEHTSGNPMTLGPRLPSPEEMTELQIKGAADNAQKWLDRTTKPKKNFKEEALKATSRARYKESMERVLEQGLWSGGMALVDESETIATIQRRGKEVYSKGVKDREPKILRRNKELHNDRLAVASAIDAMPVSTVEEREAKMIANKRALEAIGAKRRGA